MDDHPLNLFFDKIFVISLKKDIFKRRMMVLKLKDLNIKFKFFDAIDGRKEPIIDEYNQYRSKPFDWEGAHKYEINRKRKMINSPGAYGYLKTWEKIIEHSIKNKFKSILVFDDDVIFDNNFTEKFEEFSKKVRNWKIISLGVSQHMQSRVVFNDGFYHPPEYTDGSFAIGIKNNVFSNILTEIQKFNISFDSGPVRSIYLKYPKNCYVCYPNIVIADVSTSGITGSRNMWKYCDRVLWPINNFNFLKYTNILVSVIVPMYNNENTIDLCLQSLINQTYYNTEIIVVDDGSTDSSVEKVKKYKNVKLYYTYKNRGCYVARNIGILLSKGELITIQDADDIALPNRIIKQVEVILKNNLLMCGCNIIRSIDELKNLEFLEDHVKTQKDKKCRPRFGLATIMFKRIIFKKYGYFRDDYRFSMDEEFMERLFLNINGKLSNIHIHEILSKTDKFKGFYKIDEVLYVSQPLNSNNLTLKHRRGEKKYVRKKCLNYLKRRRDINYGKYFYLLKNALKLNITNIYFSTNFLFNDDVQILKNIPRDQSNNLLICGILKNKDIHVLNSYTGEIYVLWDKNDCLTFNPINNSIFKKIKLNKIKENWIIDKQVRTLLKERKLNYRLINGRRICIFDIIKETYVLNLNRRIDRKILMKKKLKDNFMFNYTFFESEDGYEKSNKLKYINYLKNVDKSDYIDNNVYINSYGAYGLLLTYKKLFTKLKGMNSKEKILLLEDDIIFHKDYNKLIQSYSEDFLNSFDVIYLGANQMHWNQKMKDDILKLNYYNVNKISLKYAPFGTYGLLLNGKVIKLMLENLNSKIKYPTDILLWNVIKNNNLAACVLYPNLFVPNLSDSDNLGKRDIYKIKAKRKWDLKLYPFLDFDNKFSEFYNKMKNNRLSLRNIKKEYFSNISNFNISKLIEQDYKSFVFIIPSFNNEPYFKKNLDSIFNQNYYFWRIIYIDDCSSDNTYNLVKEYVNYKNMNNKVTLIKNTKNMKQAYSRYIAYKQCYDDEICCMLDGDDWLYDENVLSKLNNEYSVYNIKMTYGSYYKFRNGNLTTFHRCSYYPVEIIKNKSFRKVKKWYGIPLRTCYSSLIKNIPQDYLRDSEKKWMTACTDVAEFMWVIEGCDGKFKAIEYPTYVYNIDASIRYRNSVFNLNKEQYKYRKDTHNKIQNMK